MKELDNLRRYVASLSSKISNLALIQDDEVKSEFTMDEIMIWDKLVLKRV